MDAHDNKQNLAVISEKIKNMADDQHNLFKSYKVLNDYHYTLETKFTVMETEWKTAKNLLGWIAGGSFISLVIGLVTLAKLFRM